VNIAWMIPCRYVEVHDNLATIVGAGIDTMTVAAVPTPVQFMLAVRITGLPEEFDPAVQRAFANRVRDPHGEVIGEVRGEIGIGAESARADWLAGASLPMAIGFEVSEVGTYTIEFEYAGAEAQIPMHVVLADG
jgi:hypothetical protein